MLYCLHMWAQIINVLLGVWLMVAPALLNYNGALRTNDRIVGPLVATCAIIALWPVTRAVRWMNVGCGLWLLLAPWVCAALWPLPLHSMGVGGLLIGLASVRGTLPSGFGGGWAMLWSSRAPTPPHASRRTISRHDSDAHPRA
jgi:hypothetical protein